MKKIIITTLSGASRYAVETVAPAMLDALKAAGCDVVSDLDMDGPEALALSAKDTACWHVVLYDSARHVLQTALSADSYSDQALTQWQDQAEALLKVHRANRRKMTLVRAQSAQVDAAATWAALCQMLGLEADTADFQPEDDPVALPAWTGILADYGLRNSASAMRLTKDLTIASLAVDEAPVDFAAAHAEIVGQTTGAGQQEDLDALVAECDQLRAANAEMAQQRDAQDSALADALRTQCDTLTGDLNKAQARNAGLSKDNSRLRTEIAQARVDLDLAQRREAAVQTEAEDARRRFEQAQAEQKLARVNLTEITSQNKILTQKHHAAKTQLEAQTAKLDLLNTQLALTQKEVRDALAQVAEKHQALMDERNKAFEADLRHKQDEVDRMYASTSWRITAPMRGLKRAITKTPGEQG